MLALGDTVYDNGTAAEYTNCYNPSWGADKARTRPVVGNHEYGTANASGYFSYFGAAAGTRGQGYYSYDYGTWHIIVLNSMCANVGGCGAGSPQLNWLVGRPGRQRRRLHHGPVAPPALQLAASQAATPSPSRSTRRSTTPTPT